MSQTNNDLNKTPIYETFDIQSVINTTQFLFDNRVPDILRPISSFSFDNRMPQSTRPVYEYLPEISVVSYFEPQTKILAKYTTFDRLDQSNTEQILINEIELILNKKNYINIIYYH